MPRKAKNRTTPAAPPRKSENCVGAAPLGPASVALPVLPGHGGHVRPSRASRWRAFSLVAVHVLMIAHFLHWMTAGETITPVEPSEAMETITTGRVNAGFVFFAVAIAATLILGRWLCGWGCHLVAYQDLTLWILKKLRLRPKAFRSRLLLLAPLGAAFYMFFLPEVLRLWHGAPRPPTEIHLKTTGFWDTFPNYGIAILTVLLCGVAMVHYLGPKAFCTYACPYGALFALSDKLAVGRIRVTEDCHQCGHCTSVCTSNVRVHDEVRLYGMVVDPGCMKCLDCVTVCPNGALYFGVGKPSLGARPVAPRRPARWDLSWMEELCAAVLFVGSFLAYRGLYAKVPFLMSLGMGGIFTFLAMKALKMLYARDVLIQRTRLKAGGAIRPWGYAFLALVAVLLAFTAHAGAWRYHDYLGNLAFERSPGELFRWQYRPELRADLAEPQRENIRAGIAHLDRARALAWYPVPENDLELAWLCLHDGRGDRAVALLREVLDVLPDEPNMWLHLARVETARGELDAARAAFERSLSLDKARRDAWERKLPDRPLEGSALLHAEWGMFLAHTGEADAALAELTAAAAYDRVSVTAQLALATFQLRMDNVDAARKALIDAARAAPGNPDVVAGLRSITKVNQNFPVAIAEYRAAVADKPNSPALYHNLAFALAQSGQLQEAVAVFRDATGRFPHALELRADLGAVLMVLRDAPGAAREYEAILAAQPENAEAALRMGVIEAMTGQYARAEQFFRKALENGDETQKAAAQDMLNQLRAPRPGP
ncbi:MAG: hypothetical protein DCC65_12600 [Planctomycetota bacterium]|nr:MAG: hypothetical protein DCC65_12600 [Planctomycetota bacterium]